MKIALSSLGKDVDSKLSEVFGRCPYFIFAEISVKGGSTSGGESNKIQKIESIENTAANQQGGAGISAAQVVAEKNAGVVIAGAVGPRALDVLKQFNIKIYKGSGTIEEVLQIFIDGKLEEIG